MHLRRDPAIYDVVYFPLTDPYRPITSGAYSLGESYTLTVDAFRDALARLSPDGVLVITRWLQKPPSESLRLLATLIEALHQDRVAKSGVTPARALIAFRGIQTITVLVKPGGWTAEELAAFATSQHLGAMTWSGRRTCNRTKLTVSTGWPPRRTTT